MGDRRALGTSEDIAEYLGVPLRTLDKWASGGAGPRFSKVGRYRRYRWADVEKWLDQQASEAD